MKSWSIRAKNVQGSFYPVLRRERIYNKKGQAMKRIKRILAITGVVLLVLLYLITLLCALFDASSSMFLFRASVTCTVLVPILL